MIRVTVAGRLVDVPEGSTILDAAQVAGVHIPTLCHDDRLTPRGMCRVCLVGVDGAIRPACSAPVTDGMIIDPDHPAARDNARMSLELIVSQLPSRAARVPADRSELVQLCAELGVSEEQFVGPDSAPRDDSHPYIRYDPALCIGCGRCVSMCAEVQGTFALELHGRGSATVMRPGAGGPWVESACVSCGGCGDTCPTGAISEAGLLDTAPVTAVTTTTCGYCGVGCSLDVHVRDNRVAAVRPTHGSPVSRGHTCVKGRFSHGFLTSKDRLTQPLLRTAGRGSPFREASWDEALTFVAQELTRIRDAYGGDAIGTISSARATNEENYLAQKFVRTVLGTNSIDNCSRLCHAPSAAGLSASFGLAGGTNSFDDLDRADAILLAGANPTDAHPVIGSRIVSQVLAGARLIVVDPRRTKLASMADVHIRNRPGTNVAVFNELARLLLDGDYLDEHYLAERASGLPALREVLADHPPDAAAAIADVDPAALRRAAELFGTARNPVIIYGLGVTEHVHGTDGVRTLANLAILRGTVGVPGGCGILPLRGQNNVQGASDMGALPDVLPGYQRVTDPEVRSRFERAWGVTLPSKPGLRIPQMFDAAIAGKLRALYVIGEDIATSDPDSAHVSAALNACDLVVCHDLFLSRTAEQADAVFPASGFLEKDGTFVNFDRRFQRVRPAVESPGDARSDFAIIQGLAARMRADLGLPDPASAMRECAALAEVFGGISHARLDDEGPLHWPCRTPDDPGEPVLYLDGFATVDGRAALAARPYLPPGETPDAEYPFLLTTGRRLEHYNTGSMTRRSANLTLWPEETLDIEPTDAARLSIRDGADVRLTSRRGEVVMRARVTTEVPPGIVFTAFHFSDAPTNDLTSQCTDEVTGCPEYKVTAVRVETVQRSGS